MPEEPLTPARILEATEDVLRRFGPAKATVVDVARALGVTHGSVYRHFPSKTALREAVTERWLDQETGTLDAIAGEPGPADERLSRWLETLFAFKRRKAGRDPELFATYLVLAGEASETVERHIATLVAQLARVLADGRDAGAFSLPDEDPVVSARAVFHASARFHDPAYAAHWSAPGADADFAALRALILNSLRPGP
ncbi:TetR family transcriptional regulator [Streptomyces aidingensis]|uniref:DNA-binding transcriptional regulator, AcrR family n=1 Tax=Streptomyces aidingensis TaxID=910347 RepID=A0A1I1JPF7_9ACTN|nr:TetR family transcriptional regulator [Streptomyces aidingensis]SFC47773.1 DNA-binding transcriptional regulator, AcrR family [Streptomyces aidingensis]